MRRGVFVAAVVTVLAIALWGTLVAIGMNPLLRELYHPRVYSRALAAAIALIVLSVWHLSSTWRRSVKQDVEAAVFSWRALAPLVIVLALTPAAMRAEAPQLSGLEFGRPVRTTPLAPQEETGQVETGQDWVDDENSGDLLAAIDELYSPPIRMESDNFSAVVDRLWDDPFGAAGQEIELIGMVYRQPQWPRELFVTARLSIWCCVDDAAVVGLLTEMAPAQAPPEGTWIRLTGTLGVRDEFNTGQAAMQNLPVIRQGRWEAVSPPEFQYVFPADW